MKLPPWAQWLLSPLLWLVRLLLFLLLISILLAAFYYLRVANYDLAKVSSYPNQTEFLDYTGKPLCSANLSASLIRRDELPTFLITCLLAREDARFYQHHGIDFRGLVRASLRNLKDKQFTQGGSTLSMQLARNVYDLREKSIDRKLLEIALTLRIESHFSKDEILTAYLNRIYFGAGAHGLTDASATYFGRTPGELNHAQSALLVGIIRGPHVFSPLRNLPAAKEQQQQVLKRLLINEQISEDEKNRIQNLPLSLTTGEQRKTTPSYVSQALHKELTKIMETQDIRSDGLIVYTTLDPKWQLQLETALDHSLRNIEAKPGWKNSRYADFQSSENKHPDYLQCAAITMDGKTGGIRAIIGGRDILDSNFDRSIGLRRDLGNTFTPWLFAAAAANNRRIISSDLLVTGRQIGFKETARIAEQCGLAGPFPETEDLYRGYLATTPQEVATALSTLANQGNRPDPYLIQRITSATGKILYEKIPSSVSALANHAATEALKAFRQNNNGKFFPGFTHSRNDAWLLQLNSQGNTAIWLGFDKPRSIGSPIEVKALLNDLTQRLAEN